MSAYSDYIVSLVPVSYWRLGEAAGATTATDVMAANNGTYTGTVTLGQPALYDDPDTCIKGDGTTGYVLCKSGRILSGLTNSSIVAWVKTSSAGASDKTIYCERAAAGNDIFKMDMITGPPYKLELVYRDDAATLNRPATTTVTLNDGIRHMCVITKVGTSVTLYQDGTQVGSGVLTATNTFTDASVQSRIGGDLADTNAYWPDFIDEVALFTRGITATEVADAFSIGINPPARRPPPVPFQAQGRNY